MLQWSVSVWDWTQASLHEIKMQTTGDNNCSCEHRGRENISQKKVAHWDSAAESVTHMSATHWSAWNPLCVSASWLPVTADHSPSTPSHSHTRSAVAEVLMSTFQPFDSSTAVLSHCLALYFSPASSISYWHCPLLTLDHWRRLLFPSPGFFPISKQSLLSLSLKYITHSSLPLLPFCVPLCALPPTHRHRHHA